VVECLRNDGSGVDIVIDEMQSQEQFIDPTFMVDRGFECQGLLFMPSGGACVGVLKIHVFSL